MRQNVCRQGDAVAQILDVEGWRFRRASFGPHGRLGDRRNAGALLREQRPGRE
jgi:DNA polymerase IIIc chi subunit